MISYNYKMSGTAADHQTWSTEGTVEVEPGDFPDTSMLALRDTFAKLTSGKAVFGHPGVGCRGPYKIEKFSLVKKSP